MMLVAGLIEAVIKPQVVTAEPRNYPMVCKGGGDLVLDYTNVAYRTGGVGYEVRWLSSFSLKFSKSPYAATQRPPGSGQCAWLDRRINQDEPSVIKGQAPAVRHVRIEGNRTSVGFNRGSNLEYIRQAMKASSVFYLHCYNSGDGKFVLKRTGL